MNPLLSLCEVVSVDTTLLTAEVVDEFGVSRSSVRLTPIVKESDHVVVIPKVGSTILCLEIGTRTEGELVCIMSHDPEVVAIQIGDISLDVDANGVMINGDQLGGLVKAGELKEQVGKNTALLERIKEVFFAWSPVPSDGGMALKAMSTQFTNLPTADLSDIENKKVKHG
ncbi:MAG: hypothetical protein H6606_06070 [Flavobacteriales bacterium]|nr:hypothetical protein [Flavobacteriales bacterium]